MGGASREGLDVERGDAKNISGGEGEIDGLSTFAVALWQTM